MSWTYAERTAGTREEAGARAGFMLVAGARDLRAVGRAEDDVARVGVVGAVTLPRERPTGAREVEEVSAGAVRGTVGLRAVEGPEAPRMTAGVAVEALAFTAGVGRTLWEKEGETGGRSVLVR